MCGASLRMCKEVDEGMMAQVQQLKRRAGVWGATLLVVVVAVASVLWVTGRPAPTPAELPATVTAIIAPLRQPTFNSAKAMHLVATIRWGQPTASPLAKDQVADKLSWDGYLALDCGEIRSVEGLGLETRRSEDGRLGDGDRMGPVVLGEAGDQRVYWRSGTGRDWDGVRVTLDACAPGQQRESGGSLKVVTPLRTYVARLAWSVDDFVSMSVAHGAFLDVHIAAERDPQALQRQRITLAPPPSSAQDRQMAEGELEPVPTDAGPAL